eukprot:gene9382-11118_t
MLQVILNWTTGELYQAWYWGHLFVVLCRDYALRLSEIKSELDVEGVELVAIGHEMLGLGEFYMEGFWKGQLFVDKNKFIFRELNTAQGSLM